MEIGRMVRYSSAKIVLGMDWYRSAKIEFRNSSNNLINTISSGQDLNICLSFMIIMS